MNPTTLLSGLGAAITADPSLGGANSSGRGATPGSGDMFLALVTGLLQGSGQVAPGSTPADPAATEETADPAADPAAGPAAGPAATAVSLTTPDPASVPAASDDAASVTEPTEATPDVSQLPIALVLPQLVVQATAAGPGAGEGTTSSTTVDATATTPVAGATAGTAGAATDGGTAGSGDPDPGPGSPAPVLTVTPTDPTGPTAAPADVADPAAPADQPAGAPSVPRTDAPTSAVPTPTSGVSGAASVIGAVAPTATLTSPAPTASPDLHRVADQVFPEVVRATSNAGTSRVTVKLNPESLGEVRVVLTQRRGELEVSLAAGSDARRALTDGAPELRRLLESVGRADSRILIRDLPTGPLAPAGATSAPATTRTDVSTDLAGAWSGAGRPGGESAPDREQSRPHHPGSSTATDGTPSAAFASRPTTTTRQGHTGLDLTM
ncbi:flagellar hook-length control protein FliK [Nocardioides sp. URHA0020]|uniref:flagellar hook-length control protein FliK n=1 Tax=Nocardioides sp. URHA0020 TaxID=1380392 RepID=UPI000490B6C0|nr:flagellar hook-length control protein FliK [Nocardioides sp. URHA0020]